MSAEAADASWTDADLALLESVYELQCTSKMNALYYERRLGALQAHSFWMEVVLAATASGSGLAALTVFESDAGRWAWQGLALAAALVSVVRPIYAPGKRIEAFARQQQGYHANFFNLKKLAFAIRQEGRITAEHRRRFDTFYDRHVQLSTEDEASPKRRLLEEAQCRTAAALPNDRFWWPAEAPAARPAPAAAEAEAAPAPPPPAETPGEAEETTAGRAEPAGSFFEKVTGRREDEIVATAAVQAGPGRNAREGQGDRPAG
jgi:hypothetical protein